MRKDNSAVSDIFSIKKILRNNNAEKINSFDSYLDCRNLTVIIATHYYFEVLISR